MRLPTDRDDIQDSIYERSRGDTSLPACPRTLVAKAAPVGRVAHSLILVEGEAGETEGHMGILCTGRCGVKSDGHGKAQAGCTYNETLHRGDLLMVASNATKVALLPGMFSRASGRVFDREVA